jgi:cell division protein FtsL
MRANLTVMLLVILVGCALMLVHTQYAARQQYIALTSAKNQRRQLEQDAEKLRLERRAITQPAYIEREASQKLDMVAATPAVTQYVSYRKASAFFEAHAAEARVLQEQSQDGSNGNTEKEDLP